MHHIKVFFKVKVKPEKHDLVGDLVGDMKLTKNLPDAFNESLFFDYVGQSIQEWTKWNLWKICGSL